MLSLTLCQFAKHQSFRYVKKNAIFNLAKIMTIVCNKVEKKNIVEKGENARYQQFLLLPTTLQKFSLFFFLGLCDKGWTRCAIIELNNCAYVEVGVNFKDADDSQGKIWPDLERRGNLQVSV